MPQNDFSFIETLAMAGFAALGGTLSYVSSSLNQGQVPKFWRAIVEGLSSGFTGLLTMLACQELGLSLGWTGLIVGTMGWLGAQATIATLSRLIQKRLGVNINDSTNDS